MIETNFLEPKVTVIDIPTQGTIANQRKPAAIKLLCVSISPVIRNLEAITQKQSKPIVKMMLEAVNQYPKL